MLSDYMIDHAGQYKLWVGHPINDIANWDAKTMLSVYMIDRV